MNTKWIELPTDRTQCQTKARMEKIPLGPYVLVPQHQIQKFEDNPMSIDLIIVHEFELRFAHATYIVGPPPIFGALKVGYWFDCSD